LTYAYGRNEPMPVDRLLRREGHPLGIRRAEATAIATAEAEEAATSNKKWNFGVAAGALLVAGTFAAGALGISGGMTPLAESTPEHAPSAPGHNPTGGPVASAPEHDQDRQHHQNPHQDQEHGQTTPASADSPTGAPAGQDGSSQTDSRYRTGGSGTSGGSGGGTSTGTGGTNGGGGGSTQAPAPQQPAPPAQQPAPPQQQPAQQGPLGQIVTPIVDTVDDVLAPVTGLLPLSAPAPRGPALTMINPLGGLLGL
jgi:hypothetical protein